MLHVLNKVYTFYLRKLERLGIEEPAHLTCSLNIAPPKFANDFLCKSSRDQYYHRPICSVSEVNQTSVGLLSVYQFQRKISALTHHKKTCSLPLEVITSMSRQSVASADQYQLVGSKILATTLINGRLTRSCSLLGCRVFSSDHRELSSQQRRRSQCRIHHNMASW